MKRQILTVGEAVQKSSDYLQSKGIDSPKLDAEILLASLLNCTRLKLYMDWKKPLHELEVSGYREYIRRRGQDREPVSHILGRREFYGRDFKVTKDTFSPRPETEGLVDRAIYLLSSDDVLTASTPVVFEIGTGTGCIITSIAAETGQHEYIATEKQEATLAVAKDNAKQHGLGGRISFRHGEYFAGYGGSIGLLISNPPYIRSGEIPELDPEVRVHDPMAALDGGEDGLDAVRVIAAEGARRLVTGGWTLLEIGEEQGPATLSLYRSSGLYDEVKVERDIEGHERYLVARRTEVRTT